MGFSEDRFLGTLVGLAVGDALGAPAEFKARGSFEPITDMIGGGVHNVRPGEWTDDTSMALCLAESLLECGGFKPADQMRRYVRWYREGYLSSNGECFDIGIAIRRALTRFESTGQVFCPNEDPRGAGNGSLMRLAPIPMYFADRPADAMTFAAQSSRTTHPAVSAAHACRYFAGLIIGALRGESRETILAPWYTPLDDPWRPDDLVPEIADIAKGKYRPKKTGEVLSGGYVVETLEASLWCLHRANSFSEAVLAAVNLGSDTDTTGAVCGQLAGAIYGLSGIPGEWVDMLAHRDLVLDFARRLMPPH